MLCDQVWYGHKVVIQIQGGEESILTFKEACEESKKISQFFIFFTKYQDVQITEGELNHNIEGPTNSYTPWSI